MPTILIGECKQEISSFNPVLSRYADFEIGWGQEILDYHTGTNTEVCGAMKVFGAQPDVTVVPAYSARMIVSGGTLAQADFERILNEFLDAVRAAPPVDGIYLSLHGAMAAEHEDDPEGLILQEIRKIVGEEMPIVASFDLHGILTERILQHTNAIVSYHTYPHVDFATTGERAARLFLRVLAGEVKPVTALVKIPALVRGDELITATGLIGKMIRQAQAVEASEDGLSAGMFIGNPFTDVLDLRSNSFVVTDGNPERAAREATEMANDFWAVRHRLQAPLTTMAETIEVVNNTTNGTVILKDAADATSSGASGDSAIIVGELLAAGYKGRILAPVVDESAVQAAIAAGVGNMVTTTVGGSLDGRRFPAVPITARVHMISEGSFLSESNFSTWISGLTAVLVAENVTWVVTSRSVSLYDRSLFYAHGQDPTKFDVVIVKSPHCQHHMFDAWAARVLNVDVAGSTSANLPTLGHVRCARPIFPLDADVQFTPEVKMFSRAGVVAK